MRQWCHIDVEEMQELWLAGWSGMNLAKRFKCSESTVYRIAEFFEWPAHDQSREPPPPSDEDARLSSDSLRLSPWVEARAAKFREQKQRQGHDGVEILTVKLGRMSRKPANC